MDAQSRILILPKYRAQVTVAAKHDVVVPTATQCYKVVHRSTGGKENGRGGLVDRQRRTQCKLASDIFV